MSSELTYARVVGAGSSRQVGTTARSIENDRHVPVIDGEHSLTAPETETADPTDEVQGTPADTNRPGTAQVTAALERVRLKVDKTEEQPFTTREQGAGDSESGAFASTRSVEDWNTEKIERLSITELLRVEPSSLEDYERLLVETKVAAAYAESERERLEHEVQSLRKRLNDLELVLNATQEAYEALKQKSIRLSDELESMQRRNRALELRLRDLDGEWNRGQAVRRRASPKETD